MDRTTTINRSDGAAVAAVRQLCATGAAKYVRTVSDLSLREIAADVSKLAGTEVSPSTILRWETGRTRPTGERGLAYLAVIEELMAVTGSSAGTRTA